MYRIETGGKEFEITFDSPGASTGQLNGKDFSIDIIETSKRVFHIIRDNKSYRAEVLSIDPISKSVEINVEGSRFTLNVKDRYDRLLEKLGLDQLNGSRAKDLTAPMPGLVLEVLVKHGDKVEKGDTLIILEAMKMENILKATTDAVIDQCLVKEGDSTEKNEILISFKH